MRRTWMVIGLIVVIIWAISAGVRAKRSSPSLTGGQTSFLKFIEGKCGEQLIQRQVEDNPVTFARERRVLEHIAGYEIGPRLVEAHPDQSIFILRYIPGRELPRFKQKRLYQYCAVARKLKTLHSLSPLSDGSTEAPFSSVFRGFEAIKAKQIPIHPGFEEAVERIKEIQQICTTYQKCLCHNDFHPANVILSQAGPRIIDWTTAQNGDPYFDLAKFCVSLPEKAKKRILYAYHGREMTEEECAHYFLMEKALWMVIATNRYGRSEGTLLAELPEPGDFERYPDSPKDFLPTALQALNAFLIATRSPEYAKAAAICSENLL